MKTAKEKAAELVESNLKVLCSNPAEYELEFFKSRAKQCAINTVDEIINTLIIEPIRVNNKYQTPNYWQEVKEEINKL
jgi:hypothetical protein